MSIFLRFALGVCISLVLGACSDIETNFIPETQGQQELSQLISDNTHHPIESHQFINKEGDEATLSSVKLNDGTSSYVAIDYRDGYEIYKLEHAADTLPGVAFFTGKPRTLVASNTIASQAINGAAFAKAFLSFARPIILDRGSKLVAENIDQKCNRAFTSSILPGNLSNATCPAASKAGAKLFTQLFKKLFM